MIRPDRQWLWVLFIPVAGVWLLLYALVRSAIAVARLIRPRPAGHDEVSR